MNDLPDLIRLRRVALRLTQGQLADILGWSQSRVSRIEAGLREPDLDGIRDLAVALQVDPLTLAAAALTGGGE